MNFQESVGGGARACGAATSNQSRTCFLFQYHGSNEVHPGFPGPARSLSLDRGRVVKRQSGDNNELSVSELLERANRNLNPVQGGVQIQGDIAVSNSSDTDSCVQDGCKWPKSSDGNVYVPYVISNSYSSEHRGVITSAMNSISSSGCVRFIPRTTETDYIHIQSLDGCYSFVGRQGNAQTVSLNSNDCIHFGIVQHELLHVLGFHHEHRRSDRDQYVQVLLHNVLTGMENNFNKVNTLNEATPYDYNSIMHYHNRVFSKNTNPTLVAASNPTVRSIVVRNLLLRDFNRTNLVYCSN
ncbi:hypothetical protein Q5P01_012997 [Channa striata]|uniref:Metalloendopeptidase n=1 Tax=Channa striata TaxID=64152 RepID=A0AA88SM65_CHASR|nr:hypothetical protein Q5P01_012997 [Channa striata]